MRSIVGSPVQSSRGMLWTINKKLPLTEAQRFLDIGGLISSSKHGLNILDNRTILEDKY